MVKESWYYEAPKNPLENSIEHIAMSNDGNYIVTGGINDQIMLFKNTQSTPIWIYSSMSNFNCINSVAISSSGETIVAFTKAGELLVFNTSSATPIWNITFGGLNIDHSLDISGDGNYILLIALGKLMLFNKRSSMPIWDEPSYRKGVLSEDGKYILATRDNFMAIYDVLDFTEVWNFTAMQNSDKIALSSNGEYIATSFSRNLLFFNKLNPNPMWNYTGYGYIGDLDISSTGNEITMVDSKYLYFFHKNSSIPKWKCEPKNIQFEHIAISSDGNYIVMSDVNTFLFSKSSSIPIWVSNFESPPNEVDISKAGNYFCSSSYNSFYVISRKNPQIISDYNLYFLFLFGIGYPSIIIVLSVFGYKKLMKIRETQRFQKFKSIIKESDQVEIEEIYKVFEKKYDKSTFYKKLLEWAALYKFTIDGGTLLLKDGSISDFIKLLDDSFARWEREEQQKKN